MDVMELARAKKSLPPPAMRKAIRKAAGLSQGDIAAGMPGPVTRTSVSRWEAGQRVPRAAHMVAYSRMLSELAALSAG